MDSPTTMALRRNLDNNEDIDLPRRGLQESKFEGRKHTLSETSRGKLEADETKMKRVPCRSINRDRAPMTRFQQNGWALQVFGSNAGSPPNARQLCQQPV
ncbi:hypothetical protein CDAR_522931 [Caerostris darwini]|uniref:Uncharacterized protein n=1 Tax=Caerostris darwini TaxID=1538125 RepID=A0AAV4TG29_9ARAC|nr:hypothetical protein CDAR_522931 [Caerostris darwini]